MSLPDWIAEAGRVSVSPLVSPSLRARVLAGARAFGVEVVLLPSIGGSTAWTVAPPGSAIVAAQPNRIGVVEQLPEVSPLLVEPDMDVFPLVNWGRRAQLWIDGTISSEPAGSVDPAMARRAVAAGEWLRRRVRQLRGFRLLDRRPVARRCPILVDHDPIRYLAPLGDLDMSAETVDVAGLPGLLVLAPSWRHRPSDLSAVLTVLAGGDDIPTGRPEYPRIAPLSIVIP